MSNTVKITDEHREIASINCSNKNFHSEMLRDRAVFKTCGMCEPFAKALAQRDQVMIERICKVIDGLDMSFLQGSKYSIKKAITKLRSVRTK